MDTFASYADVETQFELVYQRQHLASVSDKIPAELKRQSVLLLRR